ncbi:hypothetical protein EWP66_09325 [Neisseria meningitidis]|nr:hypothetical protein [Neisseria meningitidis]
MYPAAWKRLKAKKTQPKLPPLSQPPTAYPVKETKIAAGMTYSGLTKTSTALPRLSSKRTIL